MIVQSFKILLLVLLPFFCNGKINNHDDLFTKVQGLTLSGDHSDHIDLTAVSDRFEKKFSKRKHRPKGTEAFEPGLAALLPVNYHYPSFYLPFFSNFIFIAARYLDGDRAPPGV